MAKEDDRGRLTIAVSKESEELIRDTSLILGISNSDLISRATEKYVEAVKKQVGPDFEKALAGIKAVREIHGGE